MSYEGEQRRSFWLGKWLASAACVVLFIIPFVDEWAWTRPVLFPFAGIVAVVAAGMWFAEAAKRARRLLKIAGCVVFGLVLILWMASTVFYCTYSMSRARIDFSMGGVHLTLYPDAKTMINLSPTPVRPGWSCGGPRLPQGPALRYELGLYLPRMVSVGVPAPAREILWINLPFWLLAALTGAPTALLLYQDRRRTRPGCCRRCGYDLTGNVSGICPECGVPIAKEFETGVRTAVNHRRDK